MLSDGKTSAVPGSKIGRATGRPGVGEVAREVGGVFRCSKDMIEVLGITHQLVRILWMVIALTPPPRIGMRYLFQSSCL